MAAATVIALFLCGDIMTGRGIDQILPHPVRPALFEPYVRDAREYVRLAEARSGPIPREVEPDYVWGDALGELAAHAPDVRIVNLETAVTRRGEPWPDKGIHYRMDPDHVRLLATARVDVASLANNHVLDWGYQGLQDTLAALQTAGIRSAGAGRDAAEAAAPALVDVRGKGRVVLFAAGEGSSGILPVWAATRERAGVNLLLEDPDATVRNVRESVGKIRRPGDVVVLSVHWGGNWGYRITSRERQLAHRLIDEAGVDVIHGHSSHHVQGIEVYRGKLTLYGCGDLINDYEGIGGYEKFRGDLSLLYFAEIDASSGRLVGLRMCPTQMRRFQVRRASAQDARWLREVLTREGKDLGTRVQEDTAGDLVLIWEGEGL